VGKIGNFRCARLVVISREADGGATVHPGQESAPARGFYFRPMQSEVDMRSAVKLSLRFLAILALLGLVSVTFGPSSQPGGPYSSSLSLTVSSAWAAPPTCQNAACNAYGRCSNNKGTTCHHTAGECQTSPC
jgi:hypothetical protein